MRISVALTIASMLVAAPLFPAAAGQGVRAGSPFPLVKHAVTDKFGRKITYYMNRPASPAPILLMIQGSGCSTVVRGEGTSAYSTLFNLLPFAAEGRFAVVAVEKPFASEKAGNGTAEGCGEDFNQDFTADRWLVALEEALSDARKQPGVDPRRMLVLGESEGAVMAALVAGHDKNVTDVIGVGGSGTTQLFDFLVAAYTQCFDRSVCIADLERQMAEIRADPQSATRFAWGHPYRRWTSFFSVDPAEQLVRSRARVYLAFGTADRSTPPLSQEVAVAKLLAAGRDVTVRRLPNADHSLLRPGEDYAVLDKEYRRALDWFLAR